MTKHSRRSRLESRRFRKELTRSLRGAIIV